METAVKSLTACDRINNHYYSRHCGSCYWCDRADILGVDIFPSVAKATKITTTEQYYYEEYHNPNQNKQNIALSSQNTNSSKSNLISSNTKESKEKYKPDLGTFFYGILAFFVGFIFAGGGAFICMIPLLLIPSLEYNDTFNIILNLAIIGVFLLISISFYLSSIYEVISVNKKNPLLDRMAIGAIYSSGYFSITNFIFSGVVTAFALDSITPESSIFFMPLLFIILTFISGLIGALIAAFFARQKS